MIIEKIPRVMHRVFTAGKEKEIYVNRKAKDRLFRYVFTKDKAALLQLYNALNGTDYRDTDAMEIVTLDNVVYLSMKNDLAFLVMGTLNLYEHQSTYNPNMPLRFLIYLGQEFQKIITKRQENIYGTSLITLPTPKCIVFYNGNTMQPDEQILRLSEAFDNKRTEADVELTVHILNINFGHNEELMSKCKRLWEYAYFIDQVNNNLTVGMSLKKAIDYAVVHCIETGVLSDILELHRMEVKGMLLTEYNERKTLRFIKKQARKEGWQEGLEIGKREGMAKGIEEGIEKGIEEGIEKGELKVNRLIQILMKQSRSDEIARAVNDRIYQKKLFEEFGLSDNSADQS